MSLLIWLYIRVLCSSASLASESCKTGRSFELVERPIKHAKRLFVDDVSWHCAELVGQIRDVVERAYETAGKTSRRIWNATQDVDTGGDVVESSVGHSPALNASLASGQVEAFELW